MIVVVLQYRYVTAHVRVHPDDEYRSSLGVLGFLPPKQASSSSDPNLGLLDIVNGLKAIQKYVSYVGGDPSRVTIGGQSSGAQIIRGTIPLFHCIALPNVTIGFWGSPAAKGLFRAAILQSDPMVS